jgi:hypothetical protein
VREGAAIGDACFAGECELADRKGREDELLFEAEQVEGPAPLFAVRCTVCEPTLGPADHVLFELARGGGVGATSFRTAYSLSQSTVSIKWLSAS